MQAELDLPVRRTDRISLVGYVAKVAHAVRHTAIRKLVADNVEGVKEIGPKAHGVFSPHMEILEQRQVDLAETWATFATVGRSTERVR